MRDLFLTVKAEYWVTEGLPRENSAENTIEGTEGGRSIDMGRLKM